MSEARNGQAETKAPSATSLTEAVVAALATREGEAKVDGDEPVVSAVSVGGAIVVGSPKSDEPELTVGTASASEVTTEPPPPAGGSAELTAPVPAAPEAPMLDVEAQRDRGDELTAPRGLSMSREVREGITVKYFGRTDVGLVREHNEDNFLVVDVSLSRRGIDDKPLDTTLGDRGCVLAVCDGMGGAAAGEVASQMAVDTIHEMMTAGAAPKDRDHFARRLVRAVEEAGSRIFSAAKLDRSRRGMGTTSTVAGLVDSTLFVGQVGDSRAYVLRGDQFALITKDQSLVNQLIEAGQLTEEEAEAFEHSNIILQALGTTEEVTVDLTFLELRRGDRLLVCSDGLSGLVHADMMKDVLRASRDLVDAANQLVAMANAGGGHDNITVIVAEFDGTSLKEPDGSAKVAYQQYPLPPAGPDTVDPPPPRPASVKPSAAKPGADVKSIPSLAPEAGGALSRWWLVALLVLLVLALLGAIFLSMDPEVASDTAPATRTTLTTTRPLLAMSDEAGAGYLRFDAAYVGAALEIDGAPHGTIAGSSMVVPVPAGSHQVRVLRDGALVATAEVDVLAGHHEFVRLDPVPGAEGSGERVAAVGVEPPPAPLGMEPPPEMAPLPAVEGEAEAEAPRRSGSTDVEARPTVEASGDDGFVRRSGDTPHEPPPRTQ